MEYLLLFILGGYAYHFRGSAGEGGRIQQFIGESIGTQGGRALWAIVVTMMIAGATGNILMLLAMPIPAFLGVLPGYFGGQFDLTKQPNRNVKNYGRLTLRGMFIAFPILVVLSIMNGLGWHEGGNGGLGVMLGGGFVLYYLLGKLIYDLGIKIPLCEAWPEWAQFILGGAVFMGLGMSV